MLFICVQKGCTLFRTMLPTFSLFFMLGIVTACSSINNPRATENSVTLDKISWCNHQKVMVFMDDRATTTPTASLEGTNTGPPATSTPVTLKDWHALKTDLGFRVYLPSGLPTGSCLLSASGSVHNAIIDSNFILTYLLPDQTSFTIAQGPQRAKQTAFQCSTMPDVPSSSSASASATRVERTPTTSVELCTGTHGTTTITFSANWNRQKLQQFFQDLQPNENWMPHT
jgi:hypothetical protein